jgi:heptosyltransferase I
MRILVVRMTSMGDVILTLPAVTDMLAHVSNLTVDWLVEKPFAPVVAMHPGVNRVITVAWRKWRAKLHQPEARASLRETWRELRLEQYDAVLDFQGQLAKGVLFGSMARGPLMGFERAGLREPLAAIFYRRHAKANVTTHLVERSRQMAAQLLGYSIGTSAPHYGIQATDTSWQCPLSNYVVFNPFSSRAAAAWDERSWHVLGTTLRSQGIGCVILWGSKQEEVLAKRMAVSIDALVPPFLTVAQAGNLLKGARAVVGLCTGFTHLAAALEVPCVDIHCDFDPAQVGAVGPAFIANLGNVGAPPTLEQVQDALTRALLWPQTR